MPKIDADKAIMFSVIVLVAWAIIALPILHSAPSAPVPQHAAQDQHPNKCSPEESKNHTFWEKTDCDPVAYFTLWLVGFTAVLAASTIGLWVVTFLASRKQSRDMRDSIAQSKRAADAASLGADAAKQSTELTRTAMISTQRAAVSFLLVKHNPIFDPDPANYGRLIGWRIGCHWRNNGPTRAINFEARINFREFTPDIPEDFDFPFPANEQRYFAEVGAHSPIWTSGKQLWLADFQRLAAGGCKLYAWAVATYNDVFDGTPIHRTRFCMNIYLNGNEWMNPQAPEPFGFLVYHKHNDAT